jgi:hypothetical protein
VAAQTKEILSVSGFFLCGDCSAIAIVLILTSELTNYVDGMPWQYFYKDDYIAVFQLIAPITIAILAGSLALIPER